MRTFYQRLDEIFGNRQLKLVTSNVNKLREFQRFGIPNISIEKGRDLQEINADPINVIIHKAKDAGPDRIVEDTSFHVEGEDVGVNIRWLLDKLGTLIGKKASWMVLLGLNDGHQIRVFEGIIKGVITEPSGKEFGFDPFFKPDGSNNTLGELEEMGEKDLFSARKKAVENLLRNKPITIKSLTNVSQWSGEYQHD